MAEAKVNTEATLLKPSAVLNLFKFDGTNIGLSEPYYFYAGTDFNYQNMIYDGIEYTAIPLEVADFEIDGRGRLPRPKLTIANINGVISKLILENKDLAGTLISRKRVFVKYIDDVNFEGGVNPWGTADPEATFAEEIFYINRKTAETKEAVQFELACPWEVDNVYLPGRLIFALMCPFKYREAETCSYSGPPIADKANKEFEADYGLTLVNQGEWSQNTTYNLGDYVYISSILPAFFGEKFYFVCFQNGVIGIENKPGKNLAAWRSDQCPKSMAGCKKRFPSGALPFGGFPGVARSKLSV